ncbi:hypothetical protein M885DRAFT_253260 [Pelagophyceae sp. CCMP2097]|nr:hypothetical protein M885DRAFT_253260 [Pelagophyceae sp. CCMP2097]
MLRGPGRVAFALGGPQRQSARIQVRHSMFLWRHVPLFKTEKEEWRISKKMWKPIKPVRVDGPRGHFPKDCRHGVLLASGFFKPYYGSYGEPFNDVWRNYTEKYEQVKQYRRLRGLSNDYYCPRCDWRMHFLRRVSTKYELIEVEGMKRQIYHRKESIDATEDHTFCPNESCRIDEARIDVRHNVSKIEVIHGCISDTRFQKEKSVDKEHRCQDGNGKNRPEVKEMGRELLEKFENLQQTHPKMCVAVVGRHFPSLAAAVLGRSTSWNVWPEASKLKWAIPRRWRSYAAPPSRASPTWRTAWAHGPSRSRW